MKIFISKYAIQLRYGSFLALSVIVLKWMEVQLVVKNYSLEIYTALIAVAFTLLGIWLTNKLRRPRVIKEIERVIETRTITQTVAGLHSLSESEISENREGPDEKNAAIPGISKRELQVLELMGRGLSNLEIANELFVSQNTVKTHVARIFEKLDVKRRTQAVEKAKRLKIIM